MARQESATSPSLAALMAAEAIGTFLLIVLGCGAVHASVLTGAQSGLWQVAVVWGLAILIAIVAVGGVSGAHINPAVTIALATFRGFPRRLVIPYVSAQLGGSIAAALVLFLLFNPLLAAKEREKGVVRGSPGSEITAMCYCEYYPSPGPLAPGRTPYSADEHAQLKRMVPHRLAFGAELLGTLVLVLIVFAATDERNPSRPANGNAGIVIGLTVAALISVVGPLTQACFNPARDFGPRLFAALAGWGSIAFPGFAETGWLTVYIVAPIAGGLIGGGLYERVIRPSFPVK
ncbi:MAG: MIP/aquaporin family protein [Isosphaeraceae bacterium]